MTDLLGELYFWIDSEVVSTSWSVLTRMPYDVLCVDVGANSIEGKYGMFTLTKWVHIPLEDFPKEFQMALILLGVE